MALSSLGLSWRPRTGRLGLDHENGKYRAVKLFIRVINPDNLIDFLFFEFFPDIQPSIEFVYFKSLKGGST